MTTVDSDNFNRTVSGGWGTSSGGGVWATGGTTFTLSCDGANGVATETSATSVTDFQFISGASQQNPTVSGDCRTNGANQRIGILACYTDASTYYTASFSNSGACFITRNGTDVASGFTIASFSNANFYTIELIVNNGSLEARFWQAGGTRPTSPNLTYSDASPLASGSYGFYLLDSATASRTWRVDNFLATVVSGVSLAATLAGVGTLSAPLSAKVALTETVSGVGTLAGTLRYATQMSKTLAGVGTLSASFGSVEALTLRVNGVGTVSATLHAATALSSTIIGASHLFLTITVITHLSVTIMGRDQLHATLTLSSITLHVTFIGLSSLVGSFGGVIPEVQGNRLVFAKARKHRVG